MTTTKELNQAIGQAGLAFIESLRIPVEITDARKVFDRIDYEIIPLHGGGCQWVSAERVRVSEKSVIEYLNTDTRIVADNLGIEVAS